MSDTYGSLEPMTDSPPAAQDSPAETPWVTVEQVNAMAVGTLHERMGVTFTEISLSRAVATMPVAGNTQPYGLLHGGASVVLAETLGSSAGNLCVDTGKQVCVGLEINANHLRAVRSGSVTGTARPLHVGRSTQVWDIRIEDEAGKPVCISRITLAVLPQPPASGAA